VTLRDGAERPAAQELIRFARERVGYKAPEEIVFLERMPRTASGKVDRSQLKRMAEPRQPPAGA
jgi:acyl-coenzyme A synthetase/AMP-(fatty) acid ligase